MAEAIPPLFENQSQELAYILLIKANEFLENGETLGGLTREQFYMVRLMGFVEALCVCVKESGIPEDDAFEKVVQAFLPQKKPEVSKKIYPIFS